MANDQMVKEKKEDPSIVIPKDFEEFIRKSMYHEFLESLLDYCWELFRLEIKQKSLEVEAIQRNIPIP